MKKMISRIYYIAGILCLAYFFVMGFWSRFGLNLSWIWIVGGIVFLLAGFLARRPIPRWLKWGWRGTLCIGIAMILFLETYVISGMNQTAPANMDYLIVLGSRVDPDGPSPSLRRRLNELVTTGPYVWVRNPVYSAILLLCTGLLLMAYNLWLLLLPPVLWALMTAMLIPTEERWLRELHGQAYADYCERVNRCIPWPPRCR